ncbi:MAG: HAMP domain-containing protein [Solirubrobacterales bacterium]|nr:HAMP domain-containing protein [Solirubrobacterales bacterium]
MATAEAQPGKSKAPSHPELPVTADRPAIRPIRSKRPFGVRLWLALMFAAIGILTGTTVYLFVSGSSESAAESRTADLAAGRTNRLQDNVELALPRAPLTRANVGHAVDVLRKSRPSDRFRTWIYNTPAKSNGMRVGARVVSPRIVQGLDIADVPGAREAIQEVLPNGGTYINSGLPNGQTLVAVQLVGAAGKQGALVSLSEQPEEVSSALAALRGQRLTALVVSVIVAGLIGFLVASLITTRVKRLAAAAGELAEGHLDKPLDAGGRDEIGDLGRTLDSMRIALAETFDALSSERDRLSAVFESLAEAVIVVDPNGDVRFANPASADLVNEDGFVVEALRPWIRRATHRGSAQSDHVAIGSRTFAIGARYLPAERSALLVVRDRTEELRRDQAEREFVSNAAHELRNPIAGMSGAIEVLRSGAKDDPEAREHFLDRLSIDVDRVSRLTKALLTLARMEAIGEGEAEVVSVDMAVDEAVATIEAPDGVSLDIDVESDLVAGADPVLLRQVLIGLLTNAFKHTAAPGAVTLRARAEGNEQVMIEVDDTGTGIRAEEQDRVFDRFYRGSGSLEREGFGLGLAIAKRMVDVMGGEISVASEPGSGSTFTIKLRAAAPSATPLA